MKRKNNKKNKKGVSLMLAYALLIVMAIGISIVVYAWINDFIPIIDRDECPERVSVTIQDYECFPTDDRIELRIENDGLFNINGYYIRGTNKTEHIADIDLQIVAGGIPGGVQGIYSFTPVLEPNKEDVASFSYSSLTELKKIEIEPFRIQKKKEGVKREIIVLCEESFLVQELEGCD